MSHIPEKVLVVIPARYASQRLPGEINGVDEILVATDDSRIQETVLKFGGQSMLTPPELNSGSDRVGYAIQNKSCDIVVNLQGDEPVIDTNAISEAIELMRNNSEIQVATLGFPLKNEADYQNPNVVKVLTNQNDEAIYFSRSPIPFFRDGNFQPLPNLYQHIGVYLFGKETLLNFVEMPHATLEAAEKLEQLRILSAGIKIRVIESKFKSIGVDTNDDIDKVEKFLKEKGLS